jgi:hypothetical protein
MSENVQVGGMQEVFIQLKGKTLKDVERSIASVESIGGRVTHIFPPGIMVASVPSVKVKILRRRAGVVSVETGTIAKEGQKDIGHELDLAIDAWNNHIGAERRTRAIESPLLNKSWDTKEFLPPDPPAEVMAELRRRDAELAPAQEKGLAGAPNMNIPVLVGRVAVGIVFVDSTIAQYKITDAEKSKIISETTEGLNMLSSFEPNAGIQWAYDFKRPKITLQSGSFPAANQNGWEDTWRNAAMTAMGYSANINGMNSYINSIKVANNAQWAYALFVTKYPKVWFGYYWGNHVVMDFAVDGWGIDNFNLVVAHETGHVFGCGDEYAASGCTCTSLHGRYQVKNGNCENCAPVSVPCLMKSNSQAVCDYTRGQLGWNELAIKSRGATTFKGTWTFDLDSGVQGPASGADLWWEQVNTVTRYLVPQSGAMLANLGAVNFDAVSRQTLMTKAYTATPVNGSNNTSNKLTPGTVIAIKTNAGRYAKMRIDTYGYNLGITWVTYM